VSDRLAVDDDAMVDHGVGGGDGGFELLAELTARLASTARLDQIVDTVLDQIVALGFGAVWIAVLDEETGNLVTLKEMIDGVDTTHEMPKIFMLDMRQPIGHGFRERRMINIVDPDALHIIDRDDEPVPPGKLALPRVIYEHMRGHPFACGPLLGSRGQPVGALGLSSYHGNQPVPDAMLSHGLLRAFMNHLGIAMERALHLTRLERLNEDLLKAHAAILRDARIKAVGELAAAVAHDLNNLSGIALMAASIGQRSPRDAFEVLPRIERANRAIGDLVGRLQRVARPATSGETGEVADLREIIGDVLTMVGPILREESIQLAVDLPAMPLVRADPSLIHRLVLNLLLNARGALRATPPDQRSLRVDLELHEGAVRMTVADTGPGIAPAVLAQLFQPFVTTKGAEHVGLGLSAAHASLAHFGGEIVGRNAAAGGAIFEVTLAPAPAPAVEERAVEVAEPVGPRGGAKILAIDDDPDILFIIRAYLEPLGYEVTLANGGDQALDIASALTFDLILCDVGMPRHSGLDVCRLLREGGYRGKLVLMTGWDPQRVRADRRAVDCDEILKKPFLGSELVHAIDALLAS
jgi:signal transduction histidine kinase